MTENMMSQFETEPQSDDRYVFGVDWGQAEAATAVSVVNTSRGTLVAIYQFKAMGWAVVRRQLRELYNHWQPKSIWAEASGIGSANIEALQQEGLPMVGVIMTAHNKRELLDSLKAAVAKGYLHLIDNSGLEEALNAVQWKELPSGTVVPELSALQREVLMATSLAWQAGDTAG